MTKGPIASNADKKLEDDYREYLKRIPVSDFFGAGELIDYAERQIRSIDDARLRAGIAPEVTPQAAGWDSVTIAAKNDYNKLTEELGKLPPDQQGTSFEQMLTAFFEKHPKEGLDPEFVKMLEAIAEAFKKAGTDFPDKEFQITLGVSNLRDNTQISIQIGDLPRVDFTKYAAKPGIPDKQISGKGNSPVTFTYRDFSKSEAAPLTESISDPLKDFYPKLNGEGYKVNFGKEYGIVVRLKSGLPPQLPSLPRM